MSEIKARGLHLVAPPTADTAAIERIFEAQRENRWKVAETTWRERRAKLVRLRDAILAHRGDLEAALWSDLHKPAAEVDLTETQPAVAELSTAIRHLREWMRPVRVDSPMTLFGTRSEIRYEPRGVVCILAPWNYPFSLVVNPLAAAVAAGNCAVLKPSEKTPSVAAVVRSVVEDVFHPEEVAVVEGGVEVSSALLALPFDHFFFTGSTRVGRIVMEAAARHHASVTLELGGKSPAIVAPDADVSAAARRIAWGKLVNAGQTCVAPDYALVPASRLDAFVDAVRSAIVDFYGATPEARAASGDFCRLVDGDAFERVAGLLDDATARGAEIAIGGERDAATRYIAPTILTKVDESSAIMHEEIFGPVLPVLGYESLDDALEVIRRKEKPLALYLFTKSERTTERVLARTTAGGTVVNNVVVHLANPNLPFGGVGASGVGSYHGEHGFRAFSHERAVMRQGRPALVRHFYPPYTPRVRRAVGFVTRWLT